VLVAIGLVGTWVGTGLCTVLFLAGLSKINRELYEAARLDGAGAFHEFRAISLPAVRGELAVALTLTLVAALRTFDLVYVMTGGGPGDASRVPSYEVYDRAIQEGQVGTGITVALVLTAVILLVTWVVNRIADDPEARDPA
jgi:raffinose/stachyose/melibiose transport system permease protein